MSTPERPATRSKFETVSAIKDTAIATLGGLLSRMAFTTRQFVSMASISGNYEIEAGNIALRRSDRPDVKEFARRMITDHTDIAQKLKSHSFGKMPQGLSDEKLDAFHLVLIEDLNGAADRDFENRYVSQQKAAHNNAVILFKNYMQRGSDEGLRKLAATAVPILEDHLNMARGLERST